MQAFVVLLLAGAVAAASIPNAAIPVPMAATLKIYGAPAASGHSAISQEKAGVEELSEKPVIVAFNDQNEVKAVLVKGGLSALPSEPEASTFFRGVLLSAPEKVGITLSAAHLLELPEMSLALKTLNYPSGFNLNHLLRQYEESTPVVYFTTKEAIPAASLDKLVEMGEFSVMPDIVKIASGVRKSRQICAFNLCAGK